MSDTAMDFARHGWHEHPPRVLLDFPAGDLGHDCTAALPPASEPSIRALFATQAVERFAPPRAIFWEGDAAIDVFYLLEGCVRVHRTLQDGRRAILGFIRAGGLLGVSFQDSYLFTAEAITPARLRRLPRRRFLTLVDESSNLRPKLHAEICSETTAAQDQIICLGRTGADQRVANFLLKLPRHSCSDPGSPEEIEIPFGRLDITDYLGLTVETVSREISKLKRKGVIATSGPHKIRLLGLRSLREIARIGARPQVGAA
jgi:CRP/FNR family transcriptional regulator